MGYYDEEEELFLAAIGDDPELAELLIRTLREADYYRTAYLRADSRQEVLQQELTDLYAEVWRLQRKANARWEDDENTLDLSQYPRSRTSKNAGG